MKDSSQPVSSLGDEIDLLQVIGYLWSQRRTIVASSLVALILAVVYAYLVAKPVFESSALLLPTETMKNLDLGAASALLGGKNTSSPDEDLYQSLLTSRTVLQKALQSTIPNLSDTSDGRLEPLFTILQIDTNDPAEVDAAVRRLEKSVVVDAKESGTGGILEVRFQASKPWLAKHIGNIILEIGQMELQKVRIDRSKIILPRLELAVTQARSEWDSAARVVAEYKGSNRSIVLPNQMLSLSRLEIDKSAKEQKFLLARKEYELQLLDQAKAVPPMMVFDPANLPSRKSKPKRIMIIFIGLLLGFSGSCGGLLAWRTFRSSPTGGA